MRLLLGIIGLLAMGAAPAVRTDDTCGPPPSASIVTAWHPRPWHPSQPLASRAGIRFEPESGEAPLSPTDLQALGAARRQALARIQVLTRPDGSRHAVLGGLIRSYTVLHQDAEGRWIEECVTSDEQARARVRATASAAKKGN
jgi:hypothetical protein